MEAGATWQRSADIFAHTLLHERQHHADVHTLLYQLGIEVPIVQDRFSLPERQTWVSILSSLASLTPRAFLRSGHRSGTARTECRTSRRS